MVIYKFGGSSVASLKGLKNIKDILKKDSRNKIVVFSAFGINSITNEKLTDTLITLSNTSLKSKNRILLAENVIYVFQYYIKNLINNADIGINLHNLMQFLINECENNKIIAVGEYITSKIVSIYLNYKFVDATEIITADENGFSDNLNKLKLKDKANKTNIVVPGFYYKFKDKIELFPRGGGDITGAYLAYLTKSTCYYNYTDVNGLLNCNIKNIKNKTINNLSYGQLLTLTYNGINLFSPSAISYLSENKIPIKISNTFFPKSDNTIINYNFNSFYIISDLDDCMIFENVKLKSKFLFIKEILNYFMKDINIINNAFYSNNQLVISLKKQNKNLRLTKTSNQLLLKVELFSYNINEELSIKVLCEKHNISLKKRMLIFPFKRSTYYFYGKIKSEFIKELTLLIDSYKI